MKKNKLISFFTLTSLTVFNNLFYNPLQINIRDCKGYIYYRNCLNHNNFDIEIYMTPSLMGSFLRLYDSNVLNPYYEGYNLTNINAFLSQNFNNFNPHCPQEIHGLIIEGLGENNMQIANYFRNFYEQIRNRGFYVQISYWKDAPINNLVSSIAPYDNQISFLRIHVDC